MHATEMMTLRNRKKYKTTERYFSNSEVMVSFFFFKIHFLFISLDTALTKKKKKKKNTTPPVLAKKVSDSLLLPLTCHAQPLILPLCQG